MSNELVISGDNLPTTTNNMAMIMQTSEMLSKSTIVPLNYQNRPENCFIALEMANRMNVPVMMVMQNLYVVQGKPSWSGSAIASMIRNSSMFRNVQLNFVGKENTDSWGAYVSAENTRTGATIKGSTVTIAIAKAEGWFGKTGSKWKTMPEVMLSYRAYAWFGRVHAPELMMGLQASDEVEDITKSIGETAKPVLNPYEAKEDSGK